MAKLLRVMDELVRLKKQRRAEQETEVLAVDEIVSLVMSHDEQWLDLEKVALREGQYLATDVFYRTPVELWGSTSDSPAGWRGYEPEWRSVERISEDRADYGRVFGADGEQIGIVRSVAGGSLFTLQLFADGLTGVSESPRTRRVLSFPMRGLPGDSAEESLARDIQFESERCASLERSFGPEWRKLYPGLVGGSGAV